MFLKHRKSQKQDSLSYKPKDRISELEKKKDILYNSKMNSKITGIKHLKQKKSVNVQISQTQ